MKWCEPTIVWVYFKSGWMQEDCIIMKQYFKPRHLTPVTRKPTLRSLSLSYQMTPTFREYGQWSQKTQILKSRYHTTRSMDAATCAHPSFGMTRTKTLRSVFSWRASFLYVNKIVSYLTIECSVQNQKILCKTGCKSVSIEIYSPKNCTFQQID